MELVEAVLRWGYWAYRAIATQVNAGGGAIVLDVKPATGATMIVMAAIGTNSGTNTLQIARVDEDDNDAQIFVLVGSAGGTEGAIPQISDRTTTSTAMSDSTPIETRLFRGDDMFTVRQSGAGAQNDTLTLRIRALLSPGSLKPVVAKDRSTNEADVTIATPTEDKVL